MIFYIEDVFFSRIFVEKYYFKHLHNLIFVTRNFICSYFRMSRSSRRYLKNIFMINATLRAVYLCRTVYSLKSGSPHAEYFVSWQGRQYLILRSTHRAVSTNVNYQWPPTVPLHSNRPLNQRMIGVLIDCYSVIITVHCQTPLYGGCEVSGHARRICLH